MREHTITYYTKKAKRKTLYQYLKHLLQSFSDLDKIKSFSTGFLTYLGGIMLFNSPLLEYGIKLLMLVASLSVTTIVPKMINTWWDLKGKDKFFKNKKRKNAKQKDDHEAAA